MKLLIVEDEIAQAESLQVIFEARGLACYLAASTPAAMRMAETHPPDAVILDLFMNGASGMKFLGWMRTHGGLRETPVVITTGLPLDDISIPPVADLKVRMLQKPCLVEDLLRVFAEMGAKL